MARLLLGLALIGSLLLAGPAQADAKKGKWSVLGPWPLISIHAALLPDGRVFTYGTDDLLRATGSFTYDVWNPKQGLAGAAHLTLPNATGTDFFCNAQLVLPRSGQLFMAGGDIWNGTRTIHRGNSDSALFDPGSNTLAAGASMQRKRYYATVTTLADGRTYIQGGRDGEDRPEIRATDGSFRLLAGIDTTGLFYYYPRAWVTPSARLFGYSDQQMYFVDPDANGGAGALTLLSTFLPAQPSGVSSSEVMFAPGRILRVGGGTNDNRGTEPAKKTAVIIDINGATPVVSDATSMPLPLHWHNATVIADGRVVVTGGSARSNLLTGALRKALIWNPATGTWTSGATGSGRTRLYHSTALLLPDASILVAGGGAPGPEANANAEIYYPPYLFQASGGFAVRPKIKAAPTRLIHGKRFTLTVDRPAAIRTVTLIKAGSVTHSLNMEQRFQKLAFTVVSGKLSVQAPARAALAPPGTYLLFVLDGLGVPSLARIVSL